MGEGGYSAEMFTGLVEELGRLEWLRRGEGEAQLAVNAPGISPGERSAGFYRRHGFVDSTLHPMRFLLRGDA